MFQSAKIKLTLWYLLIIMCISGLFSLFIYTGINQELQAMQRMHEIKLQRKRLGLDARMSPKRLPALELEEITVVQNRLRIILLLINTFIAGIAGLASYFLAGRTLKPIQEMVDQQNRFITDASHELRTPITALKTSIEVTLRDKNLSLDEAKEVLHDNLNEINTLKKLSDNLLDLSTMKNGQKSMQNISLSEIINTAIHKISYAAELKNITIEKNLQDVSIHGYTERLIELFIIFLDNAIKYSHPKTRVKMTTHIVDSFARIQIQDEGIGIDVKDIENIFDRFYRADVSRSNQREDGYGLGLSIAKEIIENHNGTVNVESKVEKGTTFTIHLPIKK